MSSRTRLFLAGVLALAVVMLGAAGCLLPGIDDSTRGRPCRGHGCGGGSSEPTRGDRLLVASVEHYTIFDRSVKPSIDNFLSRYRSTPDDPLLNRWIDDFFVPAKRLLGAEFEFDPTVAVDVNPSKSLINAKVSQGVWREVPKGEASFERFLPIVQGDKEVLVLMGRLPVHVDSIRWRINANASITAVSGKKIRYSTTLELELEGTLSDEHGNKLFVARATQDNPAFSRLSDRLFESLHSEYIAFFEREYDLVVAKRTRGR